MKVTGPHSDVVISSRVRLARNLQQLPFPGQASNEALQEAFKQIKEVAEKRLEQKGFVFSAIDRHPARQRKLLVEKHLISPAMAAPGTSRAVIINQEETVSIMVNEEDHLRLQCILSGLSLEDAWQRMDELDDLLEEDLTYAFSEKRGYLTTCPTNIGTGLRASVMVHLPALDMVERSEQILSTISQLGLAVRGLYGEGTGAAANIYQLSNQVTLGQREEEIIENLTGVTGQIIDQEQSAREFLLREKKDDLRDRIMRSFGVLKYAHQISSQEAMKLLSDVRLGIDLGLIEDLESSILSELMVLIRPAFLQQLEGEELSASERDLRRAALIRKRMRLD